MDYKHQHLRNWLLEHPFISVGKIEKKIGLGRSTIAHFRDERRNLPEKYYKQVSQELYPYGFKELYD